MKKFSVLIVGLSLFIYAVAGICNSTTGSSAEVQSGNSPSNALSIASSSELNALATNWANEYGKLNASLTITVSELGNGQPVLPGQLSFLSNESSEMMDGASNWKMVIGRNAVVAIFNPGNPMLKEINAQGVSAQEFAQSISDPKKRNWNHVINGGQNVPIHYALSNNEKVNETIARFTTTDLSVINQTTTGTAEEVISAIQKDVYAIGFCRLSDVFDTNTHNLVQGIKLLPIDKNQNGRLDSFENIYSKPEAFTRGVWIGKYPHALCGNIYAASYARPTDKNILAFLTWIITDGQKYLNVNGYSDLASTEVKSNMEALTGIASNSAINADTRTTGGAKSIVSTAWLILLALVAVSALLALALVRYGRKQNWTAIDHDTNSTPVLNEETVLAPKGIYFDKTHTWAFMETDGNVKIGIDDFLQHVTGTLTRIVMKEPGERIRKGEKILTIVREGKQLNIYAPLSGTIRQQNTSLIADSSLINTSPYAEGWVYLIEPANWAREIRFLFMGERYKEWLEDEFSRLKDFFAASMKSRGQHQPQMILQDGGELTDHVLADMEPEVWEDFQIKFINTSK
ncbi:MAG: hypothetical protein H7X84_04590 [Verrucomicrobia bacterium]|nr:hypothetical protein [Prolixibacteraceae bacterium]